MAIDDVDEAHASSPMQPTRLSTVINGLLGTGAVAVVDSANHFMDAATWPGTRRVISDTAGFEGAVQREVSHGEAVVALPDWENSRSPVAPIPGEELLGTVGDGPLVVLLPNVMLVGPRGKRFRERLLDGTLDVVIAEVPSLFAAMDARRFPTAIYVRRTAQGSGGTLRIAHFPSGAEPADVHADLMQLLGKHEGTTRYGYVHPGDASAEEPLTFARHHPDLRERTAELVNWGGKSDLGSFFDLITPAPKDLRNRNAGLGHRRLIRASAIQRSGEFEVVEMPEEQEMHVELKALKAGDLVVVRDYHPKRAGRIRVGAVAEHHLPVAAAFGTIVLRARRVMSESERSFIVAYLRSPIAWDIVAARAGRLSLNRNDLARMPLPVPDAPLLESIDALTLAEASMRVWAAEAQRALDTIFDASSAKEARRQLLMAGRQSRLRADAAIAIDDFSTRVRTLFPFPIAYAWRSFQAVEQQGDAEVVVGESTYLFEQVLAFCALLAAAVARATGISLPQLAGYGTRQGYRTTLGTWTSILEGLRPLARRGELDESSLLVDLARFIGTQDVQDAVARLRPVRHDAAHARRSLSHETEHTAHRARDGVHTLLGALEFLADYELVVVDQLQWNSLSQSGIAVIRRLVGDHPIVAPERVRVSSNDVEAGSLYLRDSAGHLTLLRPYLIGRRCPDCDHWSTFYLDRVEGDRVLVKSIERGHVTELDLVEAYAAVATLR